MRKNLVRHGNSWALVIDRPILELLNIRPEEPLEITTDGRAVIVAPVGAAGDKDRVRAARKKLHAKYGRAFKKLAE